MAHGGWEITAVLNWGVWGRDSVFSSLRLMVFVLELGEVLGNNVHFYLFVILLLVNSTSQPNVDFHKKIYSTCNMIYCSL